MIRVHDNRAPTFGAQSAAIARMRVKYPALQFTCGMADGEICAVTAFKFRLRVSVHAADWEEDLDRRIANFREGCQLGLNLTERAP